MRQAWSAKKLTVFHAVFCNQQIDLKKYSKPYWQPMKGMKQCKTVSKWKRLCHQVGQSILNMLKPCEVNVGHTIATRCSASSFDLIDGLTHFPNRPTSVQCHCTFRPLLICYFKNTLFIPRRLRSCVMCHIVCSSLSDIHLIFTASRTMLSKTSSFM